jgi:SAM-dependent methyltransferase
VRPPFPVHPDITPVPDPVLRLDPRNRLNQLCDISDWRDGPMIRYCRELHEPVHVHRKAWEFVKCLDGLERLGVLSRDTRGLSVGAGAESPLFYLANRIQQVVATDLYEEQEGSWGWQTDFLHQPQKYAPFTYREEALQVQHMSGLELDFPDCSFDFAYSLSSIEHFGGHREAAQAVREMARVIRPGGVVCVVTELLLSDCASDEFFTVPDLREFVIEASGLEIAESDLDLRISESLLAYPVAVGVESDRISPHIVLSRGPSEVWTSVIVFLRK